MKKFKLSITAILLVFALTFAACFTPLDESTGGDITPPGTDTYTPVEGVYTWHELTEWGASAAAGKAEQDGEYVKIMSTTSQFGGIKSPNNNSVMVDFSKPAYINFEDFSASEDSLMIFKMRVVGYNLSDTAYIISDDLKGIEGNFSINIQDAIKYYGTAATNAELIYKAGDEDLDDETGTGTIQEGDPRIGELKFANVSKEIKCIVEIWCMGVNGNTEANYIRMKSFSITNETERTVTAVSANQGNLTDENAVLKGAESIQLQPTVTKSDAASGDLIYSSSNPSCVSVSESGLLSFHKVTGENVKIKIISRDDISKSAEFYVGVIININTAKDVKSYLDDVNFVDEKAASDDTVSDILSGKILQKQSVAYSSEAIKAIRVVDIANEITVFNNFDANNTEMQAEKNNNGGKYELTLSLSNEELAWENATVSCYNVSASGIERLVNNQTATKGDTAFSYQLQVPYLNGDAKVNGSSTVIVIWTDGENVVANRVEIINKDVTKIEKEYLGTELESFFAPVGADCGTVALNDQNQLVLTTPAIKFYMNMYATISYEGIEGKDVYMAIDIASMDKTQYANIIYNGAYVLTNQLLNFNCEGLWIINLSEIVGSNSASAITMYFDFLLNNGGVIGGEEEVIINSIMIFC